MAVTKFADLVNNPMFTDFFYRQILERSPLVKSGVIATDPAIQKAVNEAGTGGWTVDLPYFNSLDTESGDAEVLVEGTGLTVQKVTAGKDVAIITRRGKMFGATDLSAELSGKDPMKVVATQLADWWNKQNTKKLFATMNGVFADNIANDNGDLVLDLTAGETLATDDTLITKSSIMMACQLLGDRKSELRTIAMNSAVETYLAEIDLNTNLFLPSKTPDTLPTYNGRNLIIEDQIPMKTYTATNKTCTKAEIYLFGNGAIAFANAKVKTPFEPARDPAKGEDFLISRVANIMHIRGVKFAGTAGNLSDPQLATASNWNRVWSKKDIRVIKLIGNIAIA